jgi:hypothetical protein
MDGRFFSGNLPVMASNGTGSLTKEYRGADGTSIWQGSKCVVAGDADIGKAITIKDCTLGNPDTARRRVLVLGDSFTATFVPGFDDLVRTHRYAVTVVSSWGASPAPGIASQGSWARSSQFYWSSVAGPLVSQLKPGDLVFLASDLAGYAPAETSPSSTAELAELRMALENYSDLLAKRGIALAVLNANPPAREANCEPSAAVLQWFRPGIPCSFSTRQEVLRRRAGLDSVLGQLQRSGKLEIVDLMDVFCPGTRCDYQVVGGHLLYRDAYSHPSVEAIKVSEPRIRDAILKSEIAPRGRARPVFPLTP